MGRRITFLRGFRVLNRHKVVLGFLTDFYGLFLSRGSVPATFLIKAPMELSTSVQTIEFFRVSRGFQDILGLLRVLKVFLGFLGFLGYFQGSQ